MNIEKVDKNFKVETNIEKDDIRFYDVLEAPFKVYGIYYDNGKFRRMPETVTKKLAKAFTSCTQTPQAAE